MNIKTDSLSLIVRGVRSGCSAVLHGTYEGFFDSTPEEKKEAISQFIYQVKYGFSAVIFELHWERGDARSRFTLIWVEEFAPSEETIRHHLIGNYLCLEEACPSLYCFVLPMSTMLRKKC
ncbi:MAG TPA: hypothetical protein VNM69_21450 [Bacillus sp. (in: firmicutes)]|nr:hypothetical protein [Bacillus sp. (in: firmicutes)]